MNEILLSKKGKAAKIISIIVFSLILMAFLTAVISDAVILSKQIVGFMVAIVVTAATFLFALMLMVISIILIFGIYLLQNNGFWPIEWARSAFETVMADYVIAPEQVHILIAIRIILLVICLLVFIASIVSLTLAKKEKKNNSEIKQKLTKTFSILALIMSIIGAIVSSGALLLFFLLL